LTAAAARLELPFNLNAANPDWGEAELRLRRQMMAEIVDGVTEGLTPLGRRRAEQNVK
jgi:hypothetical protein